MARNNCFLKGVMMALVTGIDFEKLQESLKGMGFYVWGDITKSFFVAQEQSEKDNSHVHLLVSGQDINSLLLTFVAKGSKCHAGATGVEGSPDDDGHWQFEFSDTAFAGNQIAIALKGFGAKEADAESVQNTFSAIVAAIASQ